MDTYLPTNPNAPQWRTLRARAASLKNERFLQVEQSNVVSVLEGGSPPWQAVDFALPGNILVIAPAQARVALRQLQRQWLASENVTAIVSTTDPLLLQDDSFGRDLHIWSPFEADTVGWDLLAGCSSWAGAQRCAWRFADLSIGEVGHQLFANKVRSQAARLLAPLLHALALGKQTPWQLLNWIDSGDDVTPYRILSTFGATQARESLTRQRLEDPERFRLLQLSVAGWFAFCRHVESRSALRCTTGMVDLLHAQRQLIAFTAQQKTSALVAPLAGALFSELLESMLALYAPVTCGQDAGSSALLLLDSCGQVTPVSSLGDAFLELNRIGVRCFVACEHLDRLQRHLTVAGANAVAQNSQTIMFFGPLATEELRAHVEWIRLAADLPWNPHAQLIYQEALPLLPTEMIVIDKERCSVDRK